MWALLSYAKNHWWQRTPPKLVVAEFNKLSLVIQRAGVIGSETWPLAIVLLVADHGQIAKQFYPPGSGNRPSADFSWLRLKPLPS